jgi:hypothetical protein
MSRSQQPLNEVKSALELSQLLAVCCSEVEQHVLSLESGAKKSELKRRFYAFNALAASLAAKLTKEGK